MTYAARLAGETRGIVHREQFVPRASVPVSHVSGLGSAATADTADFAPASVATDVATLETEVAGKAPIAHTHAAADVTDFAEAVDDRVGALVVSGGGCTVTYDDVGNVLTISVP